MTTRSAARRPHRSSGGESGSPVEAGEAPTHAAGSSRPRAATRAANAALCWAAVFTALHVYWYLGGRVGFGDQADPLPPAPSTPGDWTFTAVLVTVFIAGLVVPCAVARPWGTALPRRLLVWSLWLGFLILVARGGAGFVDDVVRFTGLRDGGLTGLSTQEVLGTPHPSTYTEASTVAIDGVFLIGGVLFGRAAVLLGVRAGKGGPTA